MKSDEDGQSIELQEMIKEKGIKKTLTNISNLGEKDTILEDIENKYNEIAYSVEV